MKKLHLLLIGFVFALTVNCSHVTPFYRSDVAANRQATIQNQAIRSRLLLIGDAGEPEKNEPVLELLGDWAKEMPHKTTVVFLGDNIYPKGMPAETAANRKDAERRLLPQLNAVIESGAHGIVVPGNHDWEEGSANGEKAVKRQQAFVLEKLHDGNSFLPQNGCPGPVKVDMDGVRLIVLDTQWWLQTKDKPTTDCPYGTEDEILKALSEMVETAGDRAVVIVGHHPFATKGPHGGFYTWQDHIFPLTNLVDWLWVPLPVIGSLYPLGRWYLVKSPQDMNGNLNKHMRRRITEAVSGSKPLVYASGHEHSLQVFENVDVAEYVLVSGAGAGKKIEKVGHDSRTLFAHSHPGFMAIDFLSDGRVLLRVIEPGEAQSVYSKWLR